MGDMRQRSCYYSCGHKSTLYLAGEAKPSAACPDCDTGELVMTTEPVAITVSISRDPENVWAGATRDR